MLSTLSVSVKLYKNNKNNVRGTICVCMFLCAFISYHRNNFSNITIQWNGECAGCDPCGYCKRAVRHFQTHMQISWHFCSSVMMLFNLLSFVRVHFYLADSQTDESFFHLRRNAFYISNFCALTRCEL